MPSATIQHAISYIELHLSEPSDIGGLARVCYLSPAQLYRDFYSETGHSVKEYVRKRRLSKALALVKSSHMSLAEIAYECGYSSQQAFHKSVKAAIGQTPLEYMQGDDTFFFPRHDVAGKWRVSVSTETIPPTLRLHFSQSQPCGIEKHALADLYTRLPDYQGRVFGKNGKTKNGLYHYELYIERGYAAHRLTQHSTYPPPELTPISEYTGLFARTTAVSSDDEATRAWNYLYTDWLKASMFEQDDVPYFEEHLCKSGKVSRLTLYLPVRKRRGFHNIRLLECEEMLFVVSRGRGANAEEDASIRAVSFLNRHEIASVPSPTCLLPKLYYVSRHDDEILCGFIVKNGFDCPEGSEVELVRHRPGTYAVLSCDCVADSSVFQSVLSAWVRENGYAEDGPPFTLYDARDGFESEKITTRVYTRLKMIKKDNTDRASAAIITPLQI